MSHTWMSHVPHMNESSHTYEWVMSHVWMSHVTHMNVSFYTPQTIRRQWRDTHTHTHTHTDDPWRVNPDYHTRKWVTSHVWMGHVTHLNESCHTSEWVMSHIWLSLVTHMHESWHTSEWVMAHIWMSHGTHRKELRYLELSVVGFLRSEPRLRGQPPQIRACRCVPSLIHACDMTHSYVWHVSFIYVIWLIRSHWHVTRLIFVRTRPRGGIL